MMRLASCLALMCSSALAEPLIIATGGHFPPYILDPETPRATGLDHDLMTELCERGDFECTWVDLPMNDIFQALARGDVDVVTGGFGYSSDRDALVDFTCPYVVDDENNGSFFGLRDDINLVTARIGALDQSLYYDAMKQAGRTVIPYATEAEAFAALQSGAVDVVFGSHNMDELANSGAGTQYLGEYPTFSGGTVLGVSEDAPDLLNTLDALLAEVSADGTLGQLQTKWLGVDLGDVIARCLDLDALT